jgi:lipoyl-dependent peroxiredoxin
VTTCFLGILLTLRSIVERGERTPRWISLRRRRCIIGARRGDSCLGPESPLLYSRDAARPPDSSAAAEDEEDAMKREGSAVWRGDLKGGRGTVSTKSGALANAAYGFGTRFEEGAGTNPEELIGAAHAGCFSMALSGQLGNAGLTAESIETRATVTLEKVEAGWTVTEVHLDVDARVPGATQEAFEKAANGAKEGCPISRLLNTKISMTATLVS